jgi:hypothetical protein
VLFSLVRKLSNEWLVSSTAVKLFILSSIFVIVLIPVLFTYVIHAQGRTSTAEQIFGGAIGVLGAPATLFLWHGMWRYWARLDRSKTWVKRSWFVVLLFGFWYGSVFYCYFVYLPQVREKGVE